MSEQYNNNASTTLSTAITTLGQSTIVVTSGTGFPSTGNFRILILGEILLVTAVSGTTWTVTRGVEGTQPVTAAIGTPVDHVMTAGALSTIRSESCNVGTYANLPSSGMQTGDLYIPTDSFYDLIRYNGSSWDHFRNGRLLTPPVNASYSWDNTGNGTVTTTYGGVVAIASQAISGQVNFRYKTAPSPPYTISVGFLPHYTHTNYAQVGIGWRDSTGKIILNSVGYNNAWVNRRSKWNSSTSYNSDYTQYSIHPMLIHGPICWMQLQHDNTNLIFNVSSNGINWTNVGSASKTDFVNASGAHQVGFGWGDANIDLGMTVLHWKEA